MKKIILASASPRRKELLERLGLEFIIDPSSIEEDFPLDASPKEIVEELSLRKAEAVSYKYENGIVIGSDTIVVLDREILGKPKDDSDAYLMLSKLKGIKHQVFSGVALIDCETKQSEVSSQETEVYMRQLSEEEIIKYISSGETQGKAGAYAIQGIGATLIEKINGDYTNVVGLPLCLLNQMLKKFYINII